MSAPRCILPCVLGKVLSILSAAHAQYGLIYHSLDWVEVYYGTTTPVSNPNGVLEPGEAALLRVSVNFTPPVGTIVEYPPAPGGLVTVRGLRNTLFGIQPQTLDDGDWYGFSSPPPFQVIFDVGHSPLVIGGVVQHSQGGSWLPDPINPIPAIWQAAWVPHSYEPRELVMRMGGFAHSETYLWAQYGTDPSTGYPLLMGMGAWTRFAGATVNIPIVPAPGAAVSLMLAVSALARRRRRQCPQTSGARMSAVGAGPTA